MREYLLLIINAIFIYSIPMKNLLNPTQLEIRNNLKNISNDSTFGGLKWKKNKDIILSNPNKNLYNQKNIIPRLLNSRKLNNEKSELIILGFGFYERDDLLVSVDYYFTSTNKNISFKNLYFESKIEYNDSLTGDISSQTKEVSCIYNNTIINYNKFKMFCSVHVDNTSYDSIVAMYNFKYNDSDNIEVVAISPLQYYYPNIHNLLNLLEATDQKIYILDESSFETNSTDFNISGLLNEPNPNFTYTDIILYMNDTDEKDSLKQINCTINNISSMNYILNCRRKKNLTLDLQGAFSFVNGKNDILLIKLDKNHPESGTDYGTENVTEYISENVTEYVSENVTEYVTEYVTETESIITNDANCSGVSFFQDDCTPKNMTNSTGIQVSEFIYDILDDIEKGKFNDIFNETIAENKTTTKSENNVTYQISTVSSQYSSNYSTVALEDCESKLKEKYFLGQNETLILLKVEYGIEQLKIPIIEYQLFTKNGSKLDLNYCDNISETISIPVDIDEDEEFIHNPTSTFYDDECSIYTSEYDTDLTMYDRKNNYNSKYLALCESRCEYKGYDSINKRVECNCPTKATFPEFVERITKDINLNLGELLHQFVDVIKHSNLFLFKCYKEVFSSEGLKKNSGSYINIIIISGVIFCSIFFGIKGYILYKKNIKEMITKKREMIQKGNQTEATFDINNKDKNNANNTNTLDNLNNNNIQNNLNNTNIFNNSSFKSSENIIKVKFSDPYDDYDMNDLNYESALEIDKRSFFQLYLSLMKVKQPIYYTFFFKNDYNSFIVKLCLFLFSFSLEYAINALFYNDKTMHKIYEDRGDYNFVYRLPEIIYSFLISFLITKLLSIFIIPEEKISKIVHGQNSNIGADIDNLFKNSKCFLILFFAFIILFLLVFWYYLSSFCRVYNNTQGALIKSTITSFAISLFVYPLLFGLIFTTMRYYSLRDNKRYLYNASNFMSDYLI